MLIISDPETDWAMLVIPRWGSSLQKVHDSKMLLQKPYRMGPQFVIAKLLYTFHNKLVYDTNKTGVINQYSMGYHGDLLNISIVRWR